MLKNLPRLLDRPRALQERVFERVFQIAGISKLNRNEWMAYEESLKVFRDMNNVIDFSGEKGLFKGLAQGLAQGRAESLAQGLEKGKSAANRENARRMKALNLPIETIASVTGLSTEEIESLQKK